MNHHDVLKRMLRPHATWPRACLVIFAFFSVALLATTHASEFVAPPAQTDRAPNSNTVTRDIVVKPVDDASVLGAVETGAMSYTEKSGALPISGSISASDVDSTHLSGAMVQITGNYQRDQDVLCFKETATIKGQWDAATGKLILTGYDTVANYEAALREVKYKNTSNNPSTLTRSVSFTLGTGVSPAQPYAADLTHAPRPPGPGVRLPSTEVSETPILSQGYGVAARATAGIPAGFVPWWQAQVTQPMASPSNPVPVSPENLVFAALSNSAQVRILQDTVAVQQTAITEAAAKFDAKAFSETKYINTSDPVGSLLTTGGPSRYLDSNWSGSAGLRKKGSTGAELEASQKIGYENSNSLYFVPPDQGTARLSLRLTQPLLNGAGAAYNNSVLVLAEINANVAQDRFASDLQTLLYQLHQSYWDMYLQRAALLQRRRLLDQSRGILADLNARRDVDVLRGQIARAEAAVATREGGVIRCEAAVRNSESRIQAIVNDPMFTGANFVEMIPNVPPTRDFIPVNLPDALVTAINYRPEILQAMKEIRAASVRAEVAQNEVLPMLNAVVESYVSGLQGSGQIAQSMGDQFSTGRPSFTAGLMYEMPLGGNRAANARLQQRKIELRQAATQLENSSAKVRCEVEIAVRDVETAYREFVSRYHAMMANEAEIEYLTARWRALPGDQQTVSFALDELLAAQDRLALSEFDFANAEVGYNIALVTLNRSMGTLATAQAVAQLANPEGEPTQAQPTTTPEEPLPPPPSAPAELPPPPAPGPVEHERSDSSNTATIQRLPVTDPLPSIKTLLR